MITTINQEALQLNAKLQKKKSALRASLSEKGVLQREGFNQYDKYKYFSEAQYKALFTELLPKHNLELSFTELEYETFEGPEKQANGRMPKIMFTLTDCETGFYEETVITSEGIDKGDKAGYKAYTGALKYYLANTFMVATGDDAEKESPANTMNNRVEKKASPRQIEILAKRYTGENLAKLLSANGLSRLEDISLAKASELISKLTKTEVQ